MFRETQEEKEGERGVPFEEEGEEERETHTETHTHRKRDREKEEGRGRDTEVGCPRLCAVWVLHPVLSADAAPFSEPHCKVYTCSFQLQRRTLENVQSKRGKSVKGQWVSPVS